MRLCAGSALFEMVTPVPSVPPSRGPKYLRVGEGVSRGRPLRWTVGNTKGVEVTPDAPCMLPALGPDPKYCQDIKA